jgi:hypothetical protein
MRAARRSSQAVVTQCTRETRVPRSGHQGCPGQVQSRRGTTTVEVTAMRGTRTGRADGAACGFRVTALRSTRRICGPTANKPLDSGLVGRRRRSST